MSRSNKLYYWYKKKYILRLISLLAAFIIITQCNKFHHLDGENHYTEWKHYLGDPGRSHYSQLSEFTSKNIKSLKVSWEYESKDYGQMQMNPIVVDTLLYGVSSALRVFALDARSGEEVWVFGDTLKTLFSTSRGVSYWESGNDRRIFYTKGANLWALNAHTGQPIPSFGKGGKIDLRKCFDTVAPEQAIAL